MALTRVHHRKFPAKRVNGREVKMGKRPDLADARRERAIAAHNRNPKMIGVVLNTLANLLGA